MKSTSETAKSGRTPRRRDALNAGAAAVHDDCDEPNGRTAVKLGKTPRTGRRWTQPSTKGSPTGQFSLYFDACERPYRIVAHLKARAKVNAVIRLSNAELIARFHEILLASIEREATDSANDVSRGLTMSDRARACESDASLDEEKAAILWECEARGITEAQLFGGWR